jgi:hypothetical protein
MDDGVTTISASSSSDSEEDSDDSETGADTGLSDDEIVV